MARSASPVNTNLLQTLSFEKCNSLRDPSFSSYLIAAERATTPQVQGHRFYAGRVKDTKDSEIGVFGAEKYFHGDLEEESIREVSRSFSSTMQLRQNELSQVMATPSSPNHLVSTNMCHKSQNKQLSSWSSVHSGSSANSQSVLLPRVPKNVAHSKGKYVKNFLSSLGCNCNDKAAVGVVDESIDQKGACRVEMIKLPLTTVELVQEVKSTPSSTWAEEEIHINLKSEDSFSFPVSNSHPEIQVQGVKSKLKEVEIEKNQLNLLNDWNVIIPRKEEPVIPCYEIYNDAESDASSDLFELESFSTNEMSSFMTPITYYAPSEASIEWSVVTASAADCSAFTDNQSLRGKQNNLDKMVRMTKIGRTGKEKQKRYRGVLSGCTNLKAVKIEENEYKMSGGIIGRGAGGQGRKFRPEAKLKMNINSN